MLKIYNFLRLYAGVRLVLRTGGGEAHHRQPDQNAPVKIAGEELLPQYGEEQGNGPLPVDPQRAGDGEVELGGDIHYMQSQAHAEETEQNPGEPCAFGLSAQGVPALLADGPGNQHNRQEPEPAAGHVQIGQILPLESKEHIQVEHRQTAQEQEYNAEHSGPENGSVR